MNNINFKNIAEAHIKVKAKDMLISQLKTGDVLKLQSDLLPIIYHYGIVLKKNNDDLIVYHNDPFRFNKKGGNLISESIHSFVKNRNIIEVIPTNILEHDIVKKAKNSTKEKYHFLYNNCEHFVTSIKQNNFYSPQVVGWVIVLSCTVLAGFIILKKQK